MKISTFTIWTNLLFSLSSLMTLFFNNNTHQNTEIVVESYFEDDLDISEELVDGERVYMLRIQANFVLDTAADLLVLVDRAKASGANTVLLTDSKLTRYGAGAPQGNTWLTESQAFVEGVKSRGMDIIFNTITMGWCGSVIADAPDLTTGYEIKNQPLQVIGNKLTPVSTASIANGGFESSTGNVPDLWNWQDAAGVRTFIDTEVKRSGNASFRAEATGGEMSRLNTEFDVQPFHQYTLQVWIKTENLTANNLLAIIRDDNNLERNLTNLRFSTPKSDGGRSYFNRPNNLTLDWTEVRIAFNSLNATRVNLGLSMFGGVSGNLWWDDVTLLDTPVLNWLNRDDLPISIQKASDQSSLSFDTDVFLPVDSALGISGFEGKYDTQHLAPEIFLRDTNNLQEGALVEISGYHGLPTANGQVSCSWNSPEVYARMQQIHQILQDTFEPDGFLLNYSEIRTGGWEPLDVQHENSGAALAASLNKAWEDIFEIAPNGKHFFWNDMVDPNHNAREDYYQVNNTLDGSWIGLNSDKITIITWWEGDKIIDYGPSSLTHFQELGFKQVLGAFYDENVEENFNKWQTASEDIEGIEGGLYATWKKPQNFSQIEAFGDLWWIETNEEPISDTFYIRNVASGKYLRPANEEVNSSVIVEVNDESAWFKWEKVITDEDHFYLKNSQTGMYFRPQTGDVGSLMFQKPTTWNGYWTQWKEQVSLDGVTYHLVNRASGKFIRPVNGYNNLNVELRPNTWNGNWTRWSFEPTGSQGILDDYVTEDIILSIFPNPSEKDVMIESKEVIQSIEIYGLSGLKEIKEIGLSQINFDVSSWHQGLYLFKIFFENGQIETRKIIVKH